MRAGDCDRPAFVVEAFDARPLRPYQSFQMRQQRPRGRWYAVTLQVGHRGRPVWVGGDRPAARTLARAQAKIDRRFCGER
ncbi:hypothetical protein [Bradyrhizobium liaoningense]|uniref:hypothetical protein n=1 Tax=Bradyrhizobium liaoningense TaxID=43992 RepID=UPI001BA455C2|nr:hypothetical protein [Bradyrhizobium liaoningense]MBR0855455.1 hypothetical protein [Bradyrhizobium liaoningense]